MLAKLWENWHMQCVELNCHPTSRGIYGNSHTPVTDGYTKPTKAELVVAHIPG
jgi:hypothetical protein